MQSDINLIILGGGCAGLSLALRLADNAQLNKKIVILEARARYENDRTWCFWDTTCHRFENLITKSWSKMLIRSDQLNTIAECSKTPYQMLEAERFYAYALEKIRSCPNIKLCLGEYISNKPIKRNNQWHIQTDKSVLAADYVVDTRPEQNSKLNSTMLWQSFLGHEVECDSAVFDDSTVQLMDFLPNFDTNVHFSYLLPISQTRALIETTVFGPSRINAEMLSKLQTVNLQRICKSVGFKIKRTEHGILPMDVARSAGISDPSYVRTGLFHGGARPSSGYAFQRIQRWADTCALAICNNAPPCGHSPDSFTTHIMDKLFLKVLRASPEKGAHLFTRLFERVPPERIIRFMSDTGTLTDKLAVIFALPATLFIKHLMSNTKSVRVKGGAV